MRERLGGPAYNLPQYGCAVISALEAAGYEAWAVGGWVRDALLGTPCHDVDITTSAHWQVARDVLLDAGFAVHETGTAHGTITCVVAGNPVEVTTYRTEGAYTDHRHPDEVHFVTDVREDLARRDFTVNAMAYHPQRGILDPFGGRSDLERGVIRCVGDPHLRFSEDALRVLRAVRFACKLGFVVEPATQEALVASARGLEDIAAERIGAEIDAILATGRMGWALMHEGEVLGWAMPEIAAMAGFDQRSPYHAYDVLEHTARVCMAAEEFSGGLAPRELRWAALLHDVAKPATFSLDEQGRGHFYGHPAVGARMAEKIMRRLAMPGECVREVRVLVRYHDHPVNPTPRSVRRMLCRLEDACPGQAGRLAFDLLTLARADAASKVPEVAPLVLSVGGVEAVLRHELAARTAYSLRGLAVNGSDVIAATGMAPGPRVGEILRGLLASVVNGALPNDRDVLLQAIRSGRFS